MKFLDKSRIVLYNKFNNSIIELLIYATCGDVMKSNKEEILERLKQEILRAKYKDYKERFC